MDFDGEAPWLEFSVKFAAWDKEQENDWELCINGMICYWFNFIYALKSKIKWEIQGYFNKLQTSLGSGHGSNHVLFCSSKILVWNLTQCTHEGQKHVLC